MICAVWPSLALVAAGILEAQDPIVTDRPDFTESSVTVPAGSVQLEAGATVQWERQSIAWGFPETLLRYGLASKTELRFGLPDQLRLDDERGIGDAYFGAKFQLGPLPNGDDLAIIPAVSIPSRDNGFSSGTVDPEVKLCWSRALGGRWGLSAMAAGFITGTPDRREYQHLQTLSVSCALNPTTGLFLEHAGSFGRSTRPQHQLHGGLTFRPDNKTQYDIHAGFNLNGSERAPFIGIGLAVRH